MRETQFIGLNFRADEFIRKNAILSESLIPITEDGEEITGMFNEPIHRCKIYTNKEGRKFEEFIQLEPWSSGIMIFLALKWCDTNEPIKESEWLYDESCQYEYDYERGLINI